MCVYVHARLCVCLALGGTPKPEKNISEGHLETKLQFCVSLCMCVSGSSLAVHNSHFRGLGRGEGNHVTQIQQARGLDPRVCVSVCVHCKMNG